MKKRTLIFGIIGLVILATGLYYWASRSPQIADHIPGSPIAQATSENKDKGLPYQKQDFTTPDGKKASVVKLQQFGSSFDSSAGQIDVMIKKL